MFNECDKKLDKNGSDARKAVHDRLSNECRNTGSLPEDGHMTEELIAVVFDGVYREGAVYIDPIGHGRPTHGTIPADEGVVRLVDHLAPAVEYL